MTDQCPTCGQRVTRHDPSVVPCPVCPKKFLPQGLKLHIINAAKGERFKGGKSPHYEWLVANKWKGLQS